MKFRTTGLLLIVFVALAGYVFLVEMKKAPAQTPVDTSTWILTLAEEDVQQLTVSDAGQSVVLVRSDNIWYVGDAGGQEADDMTLGSLVASLVDLKAARVLTETVEGMAAYGLESPALSVTLGLSNNRQEVLLIGGKNPQGSQYYMQRRGQSPVYLVYSWLVDDLKKAVSNPPYKPTPTPGATEPAATPKQ